MYQRLKVSFISAGMTVSLISSFRRCIQQFPERILHCSTSVGNFPVRYSVVIIRAFSSSYDDLLQAHEIQMSRRISFRDTESFRNIRHDHFLTLKKGEYLLSRGTRKWLAKFGMKFEYLFFHGS
jgi:hypothetical protein